MTERVTRDPPSDAFGRALLDQHNGEAAECVIERSDGLVEPHAVAMYFGSSRTWGPDERRGLRLARGRVLDVGCGAGRHALHLQARGLEAWGIDPSPRAIRVCRARGLKHAAVLRIDDALQLGRRFDTVVMFGNNLGLLGGWRSGRRRLKMLHALTAPGGRIIGQSMDPYLSRNPWHKAYHSRNRQAGRMGGLVRIRVRYHHYADAWFDYLLMSKKELASLCQGTGWRVERYFDAKWGPAYVAVLGKDPVC